MMDGLSLNTGTNTTLLRYCGFVRDWNQNEEDCVNGRYVCSTPGPYFDTVEGTDTTVIWVNQIGSLEGKNMSGEGISCRYNVPDLKNLKCSISKKKIHSGSKDDCLEKTFYDPTNHTGNPTMEIDTDNSPVSTHLHGMEVRPAYDGNPLSWFSNHGEVGEGYLSYNMTYFDKYNDNIQPLITLIQDMLINEKNISFNYKVNVYPNQQQPGTLWYHDHAMSSTMFNVASGLFGFYIIRNESVENTLPSKNFEKLILLYGENRTTVCNSTNNTCPNMVNYITDQKFEANEIYRVRILNGNFGTFATDTKFVDSSGSNVKFRVIGTDSAVRK